jgi:hypothetical protein
MAGRGDLFSIFVHFFLTSSRCQRSNVSGLWGALLGYPV